MSLDLETIFARVTAPIAADPVCGVIGVIDQLDPEHTRKLAEAVKGGGADLGGGRTARGVAFSLYAIGGFPADDNDNQELRFTNELLFVVEANTVEGKNTSGFTAYQWMRRILRVLHGLGAGARTRNRATVRFSKRGPAWEPGPMGAGIAVYFINLVVDSEEPAGPLS